MSNSRTASIDRARLAILRQREEALFRSHRPRSASLCARASQHMPGGVPMSWMKGLYRTPTIYIDRGAGPRFFDVDGKGYLDFNVCDLSRVFMANRGIWDAIASAGPQASFVHTNADSDEYLAVAEQFLGEIVAS